MLNWCRAPTSVVEKACDPACASANSVSRTGGRAFCAAATVCLGGDGGLFGVGENRV